MGATACRHAAKCPAREHTAGPRPDAVHAARVAGWFIEESYSLKEFLPAYETLRSESDVVFYGNWMVAFPGETEADFGATVSLVKQMRANINVAIPFSARPDTARLVGVPRGWPQRDPR